MGFPLSVPHVAPLDSPIGEWDRRCRVCSYSRSPKNPTLQLSQKSSKSASTTPQRPIWNTFGTVTVRDFSENGCSFCFSVQRLLWAELVSSHRGPCLCHGSHSLNLWVGVVLRLGQCVLVVPCHKRGTFCTNGTRHERGWRLPALRPILDSCGTVLLTNNWICFIRFISADRLLSQSNRDLASDADASRSSFCEKHNTVRRVCYARPWHSRPPPSWGLRAAHHPTTPLPRFTAQAAHEAPSFNHLRNKSHPTTNAARAGAGSAGATAGCTAVVHEDVGKPAATRSP